MSNSSGCNGRPYSLKTRSLTRGRMVDEKFMTGTSGLFRFRHPGCGPGSPRAIIAAQYATPRGLPAGASGAQKKAGGPCGPSRLTFPTVDLSQTPGQDQTGKGLRYLAATVAAANFSTGRLIRISSPALTAIFSLAVIVLPSRTIS